MKLYLFILLLAGAFPAWAQDKDSITTQVTQQGKYISVAYLSNGMALSNKELREKMRSYQPSALEWHKLQDRRTEGLVWAGLSVGAIIAASIEHHQNNRGASYTFGGISAGCLIMELVTLIGANKHKTRAIEKYNSQFRQ